MEKRNGADPELLELVYDTLNDGLWDWPDITRHRFWWSPRYYEILGYRPGEVEATPESFFARVHPEDVTRLQADYQKNMNAPQGFTNEFRIITPTGQVRWIFTAGKSFTGGPDQPQRMAGIIRDITDLKQGEERLRRSEQHHRELVQNLSVAVVVHAPDSRILFANPMACTLLGLTLEQLQGKDAMDPAWRFIRENGEVIDHADYPVNKVLRTGKPMRQFMAGVFRPVTSDRVWILGNAFPEFNDQHQLQQIVVTFSDITEPLRTEIQLAQAQAVVAQMQDEVFWATPTGHIFYANPAACRKLGYTLEELCTMTVADVDADFVEGKWATYWEALQREGSIRLEGRHRAKDGTIYPVEIWSTCIRHKGEMYGCGIVRDITERKRNEEALARAKADLELRVQERTTELQHSNELLRALTTKLTEDEDAERLRVARLVHDSFIQTLSLAHIRLGAIGNTLAKGRRPAVVNQLETVRALIKDAIGQSRNIVSDLAPPMLYQLGLVPALDDLALRLGGQHKIKIAVIADSPLPDLDPGLRGLLFQSIRELVINAIKHAKGSNIDVELKKEGHHLCATVTDQGRRGAKRKAPRLIVSAKNGFGLFHIQQRLAGLGGELEFETHRGSGTRVRLAVPLGKAPLKPAQPAVRSAKPRRTRRTAPRKKPAS